jgi:hypothetical protein
MSRAETGNLNIGKLENVPGIKESVRIDEDCSTTLNESI